MPTTVRITPEPPVTYHSLPPAAHVRTPSWNPERALNRVDGPMSPGKRFASASEGS